MKESPDQKLLDTSGANGTAVLISVQPRRRTALSPALLLY